MLKKTLALIALVALAVIGENLLPGFSIIVWLMAGPVITTVGNK